MAPPHNQPNQVRLTLPPLSFSAEHLHRRCSKAQMCFFNILHIISAFPAGDVSGEKRLTNYEEICDNTGFDVDLNISLSPPAAIKPDAGENCVLEKNDPPESESELAVEEERATEHSEISHVGDQSSGIDNNGASEPLEEAKPRDEGYLGLLIEAAQLIESEPNRKPPIHITEPPASKYVETSPAARGGAKRKPQCWTAATEAEWYAEFEDTSPVVKSKRGRNQVLPYKYRDSVVEPLVRWSTTTKTTTSFRHRSITHTPCPTKRRSK